MPTPRRHNYDPAHDILAAEEFGMPAPDPALHAGPVTLPGDPTGIAEPHDVLAAEEFAMPAGHGDPDAWGPPSRVDPRRRLLAAAALGLLATFVLHKRRT
jgi:hypothetical protein